MAALVQVGIVLAHGGVAGAIVEVSVGVFVLALGLAAWVGGRKDRE